MELKEVESGMESRENDPEAERMREDEFLKQRNVFGHL